MRDVGSLGGVLSVECYQITTTPTKNNHGMDIISSCAKHTEKDGYIYHAMFTIKQDMLHSGECLVM
jgi:hypothetical protein